MYSFRNIHVSVNISNQTLLCLLSLITSGLLLSINQMASVQDNQTVSHLFIQNLLPLLTQLVRGLFKHFPNNKTSPKMLKLVQMRRTFT